MKAQNRFAELQKRVVLIDERLSILERAITTSDRSAALKVRQEVILQRLCSLEGSHVEANVSGTQAKLGTELKERGVKSFSFKYAAKLHGEKVKRFLHKTNGKLGIQYFRPRQAAFETSEKLSGYPSGSVTPVGLKTPLPIILSHEIAKLQPDFFWMGGGEEFLKLGLHVSDFVDAYKPFIVDCTY
ncbi:hypothetical protein WJX79_001610 [Trebouxia sp. C0005]